MTQIRVSIFSDDPFFREGLQQLIRPERSLALLGGDRSVRKGIDSNADVVLVDSRTDGVLDYCANLNGQRPRVIFLSVPTDAWAVDALAAGARGVIRKQDAATDVLRAIAAVIDGRVWAPRHVVVDTWLRLQRSPVQDSRAAVVEQRLTSREREVARCVTEGMSNKEVADRLAISAATVKAHLTRIFAKLAVHGRGELIAAYHGALTNGIRRGSSTRLRRLA